MEKGEVKNILFGAIGRHNFGDLLFPHIIEAMLPDKTFIKCDLIAADMTAHGGHVVESIFDYIDTPCNVVHVGGETGGCSVAGAKIMLNTTQHIPNMPLAYILDKCMFTHPNRFIANSIGGVSGTSVLDTFDYVSVRNAEGVHHTSFKHVPDSACLTRYLFEDKIGSRTISDTIKNSIGKYVAVQVSAKELNNAPDAIFDLILEISQKHDLGVALFCAGTAPLHDSLESYANTFGANFGPGMSYYADNTNIWDICNIISGADVLISTSLHAHIIAKLYGVDTITLSNKKKVKQFNSEWATLSVKTLEEKCLRSIEAWSSLLKNNES